MMESNEDKLLREFFAKEKKEIADNGFSRRVMRSLPNRVNRLMQVWAVFVSLVALMLFFAFDGLQAVVSTLRDVFVSMVQSSATNFDPKSLVIAAVVLAFLGARKVWSLA